VQQLHCDIDLRTLSLKLTTLSAFDMLSRKLCFPRLRKGIQYCILTIIIKLIQAHTHSVQITSVSCYAESHCANEERVKIITNGGVQEREGKKG